MIDNLRPGSHDVDRDVVLLCPELGGCCRHPDQLGHADLANLLCLCNGLLRHRLGIFLGSYRIRLLLQVLEAALHDGFEDRRYEIFSP